MMKRVGFLLLIVAIAVGIFSCAPKYRKYMDKGKKHFEAAEFELAAQNYQKAISEGGPAGEANYYVAEAYRRSNRVHESEEYYKKAVDAQAPEEDAHFYYAYALKSNGKYEDAMEQFTDYVKIGSNFDYINRAKNEIENLKVLSEMVNKRALYKIINLKDLNTKDAEYAPFMYDGVLYFTTNRGVTEMHLANMIGFTEIYKFIFDGVTATSGTAQRLPDVINTDDAHEANPIFTKDGKTMIFARGNDGSKKGAKDVDIYETTMLADGTWGEPVLLKINDPNAWDACPALSADQKTLFFASNREGGNGNVDVYKATRNEAGEWEVVENMGSPINTRGNDMFPYEDVLGNFYFSSDGHPSLGALDLFKVVKVDGKIKVENMGTGLNSSYDDFAIFWKDTIAGFFTSNRPATESNLAMGDDDIYEFIDESKIRIARYYLDGDILGEEVNKSKHILPGATVLVVNEKGDTIHNIVADEKGQFSVQVEPESRYKIIAMKDGYLTEDTEVFIKKVEYKDLQPGENEIRQREKLTLILPRKSREMVWEVDNIYYDYDKWDIRQDAALELAKVVEVLKLNPDISIELGSHTDERGSSDYNRKLAQKRAQSAVNWLVEHGIERTRLTAKGYGEDQLKIKGATTEEDHQKNRRTTFRITSIDPSKTVKVVNKGGEEVLPPTEGQQIK
jgi:peptidoglycan-associated lipoprotein